MREHAAHLHEALEHPAEGPPWPNTPEMLAWLHESTSFAFNGSSARIERAEAFAVLADIHRLARATPEFDTRTLARRDASLVGALVGAGRRDDARALLDLVLQPAFEGEPHVLARWHVEAAQIERQARRFEAAENELARAAELIGLPSSFDARWSDETRFFLSAGRTLLALQLGTPDLADPHLSAARAAAERLDDSALLLELNFLELSAANALLQPQRAIEVWDQFRERYAGRDFDAAKLARNQIRAAIGAVDLALIGHPAGARAEELLASAAATSGLSANEQATAHAWSATHALHEGRFEDAERGLAAARTALERAGSGAALAERREQLAGIAVRAARLSRAPREVLEERRRELESAFERSLSVWLELPPRAGGVGPLRYRERREVLAELMLSGIALHGEQAGLEAALDTLLRLQAAGSLARELGARTPTLLELRQRLFAEGRGALYFLPARTALHVLALDGGSLTHHEIQVPCVTLDATRLELNTAIGRVRAIESSAEWTRLEDVRARLSRYLFDESVLERISGWSRLEIVGIDSFGYVPIEYLLGRDARPLGRTHIVGYWPSFVVALWQSETGALPVAKPASELVTRFVVCTDPGARPTDGVEALEFGSSERERFLGAASATRVQLKCGAQATSAEWTAPEPELAYVHVLAHGRREPGSERSFRLLLYGGEELDLARLEELRYPPLAIVTACGAQAGSLRRGDDGRNRLTGALVRGGARASVASELDVDYDFALDFMGTFHDELFERGLSVGEALRAARERSDDGSSRGRLEPYLFHAVGLTDFALATPDTQAAGQRRARWIVLAAALGIALAGAWLVRRRR
ncbi:MAG: CHAT domain-containing protein [Planctomycetes bacterium]|nr:CHAT domain-containing protein [Planctomycetota bacterium]